MTPEEIILHKNLVTSSQTMNSAAWSEVSAALRDRAFFSSRVESVRFLETCRTRIAEMLANKPNAEGAITSRAQVVSDIMRAARESGIAQGTERLTDPGSVARANVIIDTNAGMAAGYAKAIQSNSYGARLAFPAQELVRIEERQVPRSWQNIWRSHGGKMSPGDRMIALKEDPIWSAISRFGTPYPPFDFNSGMGVDDVSYEEALELGVLPSKNYQPPKESPLENFNASLEAELTMDRKSDAFHALREAFGDQIVQVDGKVKWRSQFVRDVIEESYGENGRMMKLGKITNKAFEKVPQELKSVFEGSSGERMGLTVTKELATHIKNHEHYKADPRKTNMPLMPEDLDLIPTIWRDPDRVVSDPEHPEGPVFEFDTPDGGVLRLPIIKLGNTITTGTFYKMKRT